MENATTTTGASISETETTEGDFTENRSADSPSDSLLGGKDSSESFGSHEKKGLSPTPSLSDPLRSTIVYGGGTDASEVTGSAQPSATISLTNREPKEQGEEGFEDEESDPEKGKALKVLTNPREEKKRFYQKATWWMLLIVILLLFILLGIGSAILSKLKSESEKSSLAGNADSLIATPTIGPTDAPINKGVCLYKESPGVPEEFLSTGCFEEEPALEEHTLWCASKTLQAMECKELCLTRFFAVSTKELSCKCFSEAPATRISISGCGEYSHRQLQERQPTNQTSASAPMELYFNINRKSNSNCGAPISQEIRDFLVQEDSAPFGFDIISNTFRTSPFDMFNDECGTNMYEIFTDVSEDQSTLKASSIEVMQFSKERKKEHFASMSYSSSASASVLKILEVGAEVSASMDLELTNVYQSSGAEEKGSKLFRATAVKRLAGVEIPNFDSQRNTVTFNREFAQSLKNYMNGGFQKHDAYAILREYGEFVVTRGIFGGYLDVRMTMTRSRFESFSLQESDFNLCFEAAMKGQMGIKGLGGASTELEAEYCNSNFKSNMASEMREFQEETNEHAVVGGTKVCEDPNNGETCSFEVEPRRSTLLTTLDKYPSNDIGIQLRLLSEFLHPAKISPLEVRRWHITEEDFKSIHSNFEIHILEYLQEVNQTLSGCVCPEEAVVYLVEDAGVLGGRKCECYDPADPAPVSPPTIAPTVGPGCNEIDGSHAEVVNRAETSTYIGSYESDNSYVDFLGVACYKDLEWIKKKSFQGTQGKWFHGEVTDGSRCTGKLEHKLRLTVPDGVDWNMKVYQDNPDHLVAEKNHTEYGRAEEYIVQKHDGGNTGRFEYWVKVEYGGSGESCSPWELSIYAHD